jgi:hypothetical protein
MSNSQKIRAGGARKCPEPLSMSALITFAEKVIRTDKDAALRAQNSVADMGTPSNDVKSTPKISDLHKLCGQARAVKIIGDDNQDDESDKVITFDHLRRQT